MSHLAMDACTNGIFWWGILMDLGLGGCWVKLCSGRSQTGTHDFAGKAYVMNTCS